MLYGNRNADLLDFLHGDFPKQARAHLVRGRGRVRVGVSGRVFLHGDFPKQAVPAYVTT